jgi:GntR family transcriptional regulator
MEITLSHKSQKPIYRQLYDQISAQIIRGDLEKDQALPPIRTMAKELRISVITVKKAWELLERDGLIYGVVGRGSFVEDLSREDRHEKRSTTVSDKLRQGIEHCREMGLTLDEVLESVREIYEHSGGPAE